MLVVFCSYGLGFWYGAKLIREDSDYDVSNVLIVSPISVHCITSTVEASLFFGGIKVFGFRGLPLPTNLGPYECRIKLLAL